MHFIPPMESRQEAEEDKPYARVHEYMSRSKVLENEDADEVHKRNYSPNVVVVIVVVVCVCVCMVSVHMCIVYT